MAAYNLQQELDPPASRPRGLKPAGGVAHCGADMIMTGRKCYAERRVQTCVDTLDTRLHIKREHFHFRRLKPIWGERGKTPIARRHRQCSQPWIHSFIYTVVVQYTYLLCGSITISCALKICRNPSPIGSSFERVIRAWRPPTSRKVWMRRTTWWWLDQSMYFSCLRARRVRRAEKRRAKHVIIIIHKWYINCCRQA